MSNKKLIAGFDISTTTIGISFVYIEDKKIKEINYFYYKPKKTLGQIRMLFEAKKFIMDALDKVEDKYKIKATICVEDILLFAQKTTYKTIAVLSAINRVLSVGFYERYGAVNLFAVSTIRATIRKEFGAKERIEKKQVPLTLEKILQKHIPSFKFDWEITKAGKRKNCKDKLLEENFDKADALAVAMTYIIKNKEIG